MGVPQTRHRVFFAATRLNRDLTEIDMSFNYKEIVYGEIKSGQGEKIGHTTKINKLLCEAKCGEADLSEANKRLYGKDGLFCYKLLYDKFVFPTITAHATLQYRFAEKEKPSKKDFIAASTFPQDYDFIKNTANSICYICGMSVPPLMIKRLVTRLIESGLFG